MPEAMEEYREKIVKKVGFGIIGAGTIAEMHGKSIESLDNARLVAFFDTNAELAERRAAQFKCKAYSNLEAFLADSEIEAVTIATPSGLHGVVAVPAARAGKHILCEKPLETTLEKADEIIRACEENHVLLSSVFQLRFIKQVQLIRQAVAAGRFGKMILASAQMHWYRDPAYYAGSTWHGTWKIDGGGALMNQAIHLIDLLLYVNGAPEEVMAVSGTLTHDIEVEDTLCATVRYRNGAMGTIEVTTSCAPGFPKRLEFAGSDGSVILEEDKFVRWEFVKAEPQDSAIRQEFSGQADAQGGSSPVNINVLSHACQIFDLANAIRTGSPLFIDGHEGRRAVEFICGVYESARTGRPYRFQK